MKPLCILLFLTAAMPDWVAAASDPQPLERCEPDAYVYQWRDAAGQWQMGDCAPEGAEGVRAVARSSLQPTIIQPPPKPTRSPARKKSKRASRSTAKPRGLSAEKLQGLSAECRWLVGRIEHLKGLVQQHKRDSNQPSIWQPELNRWRRELRKARCGVRI